MTSLTTSYEQFNATTVALSPYPFCHNKQVCITLTGTLLRPIIQGAEYHVTGRYLGRLVYTDVNNDLCASLSAAGMSCPIAIGTSALNLCRTLRYNFPPNVRPGLFIQMHIQKQCFFTEEKISDIGY